MSNAYIEGNGTEWVKRGEVWTTVTQPGDPAMDLIANPNIYSVPNKDIYNPRCYICVDPEFAQMGLPLCYPCGGCGGHIAADDVECSNKECSWDARYDWEDSHELDSQEG